MWLSENVSVYKASGHSLSLREAYASSQTMHGPVAKTLAVGPASIFSSITSFQATVSSREPQCPPQVPIGARVEYVISYTLKVFETRPGA